MLKNIKGYTDDTTAFESDLSTFDQDFKYTGKEEILRGIYYWDSERSLIFLSRHEVLEDLVNTCVHETIHHCIYQIVINEDEGLGTLALDMEQEHDIIRNMSWADYWAVDGYCQIRGVFIKSKLQPDKEKTLNRKYDKKFEEEMDKWL